MSINLPGFFHHTPVQTQNVKSRSLDVLKEATSQLMSKLQEVKQSAEKIDSSRIESGNKTNQCFKKLNRECNRIVINGEKFAKKGLVKNHDAIALDTLKIYNNLHNFIESTPMNDTNKMELNNLLDVVGSAIKSHTSTKKSTGIDLNGLISDITKLKANLASY